jgi:outer membrane murein-binding lipoprotein Lpp
MPPSARILVLGTALLAGCAVTAEPAAVSSAVDSAAGAASTVAASPRLAQPEPASAPEEAFGAGRVVDKFGVRLTGVRLTANGYVVDLRYRVLDPDKAQGLLDRKVRPVLVDETTGNRFYVPVPPTVGALRQTSRNKVIHTDRDYFMLFANPDRKLQAGSKVALYVGEERFGSLLVAAQSATAASQPGERTGVQPPAR